MKKFLFGVLLLLTFGLFISNIIAVPVSASNSGVCSFLPCQDFAAGCPDGECPNTITATGVIIRNIATLIFAVIFIYGVYKVITAAITIIRSEGDSGKIEAGSKMIRGAMIGIGMIFIGVIGVIIVIIFFEATDIFRIVPEDPDFVDVPVIGD